jgi:hypothetical protein
MLVIPAGERDARRGWLDSPLSKDHGPMTFRAIHGQPFPTDFALLREGIPFHKPILDLCMTIWTFFVMGHGHPGVIWEN